MDNLPTIPLSQVKKLIERIELTQPADARLRFEFVIGSLFPTIYDNIVDSIKDAYTQGFIDGQKQEKEYINASQTNS